MTIGRLLLEGGAEFGGKMEEPDRRAMELAGGPTTTICILPTAAAPDHNHKRAGQNGVRWFKSLGATNVVSLDVIDAGSAKDESFAAILRKAQLIYLLGGFPGYLGGVLKDSLCWQAALEAYGAGAVIAGSSAGAMVLCEYFYDPEQRKVLTGLNLIRNVCVLPHHNNFGKNWAAPLRNALPDSILLGIDESTGMLSEPQSKWKVYGAGRVTLYRRGETQSYARSEIFSV